MCDFYEPDPETIPPCLT